MRMPVCPTFFFSSYCPFSSFCNYTGQEAGTSARTPPLQPPSHPTFTSSAISGADCSMRMAPQLAPAFSFPNSHFFPPATHTSQEASTRMPLAQPSMSTAPARWPSHTLASAELLPPPPHTVAQEPPPVSSQLRSLILAGGNVDLPSFLTIVPTNESHCSFECGLLTTHLKDSIPTT